jgi:hypothetical protein
MAATENQDFVLEAATNLLTKTQQLKVNATYFKHKIIQNINITNTKTQYSESCFKRNTFLIREGMVSQERFHCKQKFYVILVI